MSAADRRQAAERAGRRAEWLAALHLQLAGFAILARRFKCPAGEIDIVAKRGRLLVLAEVKARADADAALLAVTAKARKRIEAAGRAFLSRHPRLADCDLRYDIVAVSGLRVRRFADAWRER